MSHQNEIDSPEFNKWYSLLLLNSKEQWQRKLIKDSKESWLKRYKAIIRGRHKEKIKDTK